MYHKVTLIDAAELSSLHLECVGLLKSSQRGEQLSGSERARLDLLFEQLSARLYRFALKRCGEPEQAHDITQEALLVTLRRLPELPDELKLLPWCFGVVRRLCLKQTSRQRQRRERSLEELMSHEAEARQLELTLSGRASDEADPERWAARESDWDELSRAIQSLEPLYREALLLRDVEGLSAEETAQVVGASVGAVKSRLHRARESLRVALSAPQALPALPRDGCPDIRRVFSEHLEGDLSPSLCIQMESHVRACLICAQECDELKRIISVCSATPAALPHALAEQLRGDLKRWLDQHPHPAEALTRT
jgi:RNA polymerase sigma-70 factor (ECF subfamily)